jgi:hypothetical protein
MYRDIPGNFKPSSYPMLACGLKPGVSGKPVIPYISHEYSLTGSPYARKHADGDGSGIQVFDRTKNKAMQAQNKQNAGYCALCKAKYDDEREHISGFQHPGNQNDTQAWQYVKDGVDRFIRNRTAEVQADRQRAYDRLARKAERKLKRKAELDRLNALADVAESLSQSAQNLVESIDCE